MSKSNIELGFAATTDYPDIEVEAGQQLTRSPVICAYFNLLYKEWKDEALEVSSDEIVSAINAIEFEEGQDDEQREQKVLDALHARKHGEKGEDVEPIMDAISAQKVRADASNFGAKLPKSFTEHCNVYLDAIDDVKLACLVCLDDVAGRVFRNDMHTERNWKGGAWSKDEIIKLPVPGTEAPKNTVIDASNRHRWDKYKFKTESKEIINSSFYLDAAISSEPGSTIWEELQGMDKAESDDDKKKKETLRKRLANCAKFLRDGVTVAKALIEFERLGGKIVYQVQREEDGSPQKGTPYPLRIWPENATGKAESFTLSNMKAMLKVTGKDNVVDVAIAKGGTFAAFKAAMPEKKRSGDADKKIVVTSAKQMLATLDTFGKAIEKGWDTQVNKLCQDKEGGLAYIEEFGNFMSVAGPLWENYKADYGELKAKEQTARDSKKHKAA